MNPVYFDEGKAYFRVESFPDLVSIIAGGWSTCYNDTNAFFSSITVVKTKDPYTSLPIAIEYDNYDIKDLENLNKIKIFIENAGLVLSNEYKDPAFSIYIEVPSSKSTPLVIPAPSGCETKAFIAPDKGFDLPPWKVIFEPYLIFSNTLIKKITYREAYEYVRGLKIKDPCYAYGLVVVEKDRPNVCYHVWAAPNSIALYYRPASNMPIHAVDSHKWVFYLKVPEIAVTSQDASNIILKVKSTDLHFHQDRKLPFTPKEVLDAVEGFIPGILLSHSLKGVPKAKWKWYSGKDKGGFDE